MPLRCLVTDDEPIARQILETYIAQTPQLQHLGSCSNALEALAFLQEREVDLLFLDINMPHLSGLSLLKTLQKRPAVVLTTAYPQYAIEGFELAVSDYLLKPFSLERFLLAVTRVQDRQAPGSGAPVAAAIPEEEALFFKTTDKIVRIAPADILFAEAYGNYTKLFTSAGMHLLPQPLGQFQGHLPAERFLRIHKSFLIALQKLESIEPHQVTLAGKKLPVGKIYRRELLERIKVR